MLDIARSISSSLLTRFPANPKKPLVNGPVSMGVQILRSDFVPPESRTPNHPIWLSNLDVTPNRKIYTPTISLYPFPNGAHEHFFDVGKLKSSLSKTLVPFYPFAGELRYGDDDGRIEIHCTGKGAVFVEASCDSTVEEYGEFTPGPSLLSLLVPEGVTSAEPPCSLLLVQVTRFACGGVCLGMAVHHMLADGISALRFINAWADVARAVVDRSSLPPLFLDRSLLAARLPPSVDFHHTEYDYCGIGAATNLHLPAPISFPTTTSIFRLSKPQVLKLKNSIMGITTFSAVLAHVWRSSCKAKRLSPRQRTRMYMQADVSTRVRPPLPTGFLGNTVVPMKAEATAGVVSAGTVGETGRIIEHAKSGLSDRYIRSLIDFLEVEGTSKGRRHLPEADHVASNWMNLPIYEADFGWGRPIYVNRAAVSCNTIFVLRDPKNEGGVVITVTLEEKHMSSFSNIFYEDLDV